MFELPKLVPFWECEICESRHYSAVIDLGNTVCDCGIGKGLWFAVANPESRMPMSRGTDMKFYAAFLLGCTVLGGCKGREPVKPKAAEPIKHYHEAYGTNDGGGGWLVKSSAVEHPKRKKKDGGYTYLAQGYAPDPFTQDPFTQIETYNPHLSLTLKGLKRMQENAKGGPVCIYMVSLQCWVMLDPDPDPIDYSREGQDVTPKWPPDSVIEQPGDHDHQRYTPKFEPLKGVLVLNCDASNTESDPNRLRANCDNGVVQLNWNYDNKPKYIQCHPVGACEPQSTHPSTPDSKVYYNDVFPSDGLVIQHKGVRPTTPADVTNLMEQIAPTKDQYICRKAGECFPECDSPLTPSITRACYQITYGGKNILLLPSNYAHGFTCPDEFESCGVVNSTIYVPHELSIFTFNCTGTNCGPAPSVPSLTVCPDGTLTSGECPKTAKPNCRMPADIDVCPAVMLDPKTFTDDPMVKNYRHRD